MTGRTFSRLVFAATALGVLALTHQARGGGGAPQHYYSYYKTPVPLALNTHEIAVLAPGIHDETAVAEVLAPFGVAAGDVGSGPITGWVTISTPVAARTDPGLRALVRRLPCAETIQFVSPVFTSERGWPVMITPEIFVGFAAGVPGERAEAILRAAGAGEITDRDFARMDGVYRLRTAFTNGFDVLDAANALAERPEVRFAEPGLIITGILAGAIPDDEQFFRCWGLHSTGQNIFEGLPDAICQEIFPGLDCADTPPAIPDWDMEAPEAWNVTSGDPSVIAVVFEQGVQLNHPDLMIDPSLGMDFTGDDGSGFPVTVCENHGTWVAGTLGARMNNTIGVAGIAPNSSVASARIGQMIPDAGGDCPTTFHIPRGRSSMPWTGRKPLARASPTTAMGSTRCPPPSWRSSGKRATKPTSSTSRPPETAALRQLRTRPAFPPSTPSPPSHFSKRISSP
jgi:hypothetical protein